MSAKAAFGYNGVGLSLKGSAKAEQTLLTSSTSLYGVTSVVVRDKGGESRLQLSQLPALSAAAIRTLIGSGPVVFQSTYGAYFVLSTRRYAHKTLVIRIWSSSSDTTQQVEAGIEGSFKQFSGDVQTQLTNVGKSTAFFYEPLISGTAVCNMTDTVLKAIPHQLESSCYNEVMAPRSVLADGLETVLMRFSDLPTYVTALRQYKGPAALPAASGMSSFDKQELTVQNLLSNIWARCWFLKQTGMNSLSGIGETNRAAVLFSDTSQLQAALAALVTDPPRSDAELILNRMSADVSDLERNVMYHDRCKHLPPTST